MRFWRGPRGPLLPGLALAGLVAGTSAVTGAPLDQGAAVVHADGPPAGHTGGFGEPTCLACHLEYPLNAPGGSLRLEGWPEVYEPGRRYMLTVVLTAPDMMRAGFQLSVRCDGGTQAGRLESVDSRVAVQDSLGIAYAQHAPAGTGVPHGQAASWSLAWVAPDHGGTAQAHVAANSANGDNSPFGDLIYAGSWTATAARPPSAAPRRWPARGPSS